MGQLMLMLRTVAGDVVSQAQEEYDGRCDLEVVLEQAQAAAAVMQETKVGGRLGGGEG